MSEDSQGPVVVVTGAARGLGRDYAAMFAADGARVVLADIQADAVAAAAEDTASATGAEVIGLEVDVASADSVATMIAKVEERLGGVDVLINNAGIWGDLESAPLSATDPNYFDLVMAVNVRGPLLCAQAVLDHMRAEGWGRIINISSMGAYMPSGVYGVSKLALNSMTFALATELGPSGITVNAVAPGPIDNEATRAQLPKEAMIDKMIAGTAMKRMGTSRDLYGMIRYLVSRDADWVTGQTFLVNGGYNSRL
ncbi:SDR family NAD(P)-dependent oxidoreductase [Candidatus Poriferisocius sp.]|uniref:SDR family NAD(P)-dependent oxidoreductase n=1 Tax=Candidatus Poriferisocius sp. TaxID=3101276 RepID=UPI003B5A0E5F